ncbi:unnamed protein product [Paramecium sonneborni]|uniref:Uncharacterized protein n=1 Tax=Paramecium sonneborni TaxID=65129 RepID=A0A8S1Q9N8_9CILI|nr:unnamed protein product [Paramecium sonneborni]
MEIYKPGFSFCQQDSTILHQIMNYFQVVFEQIENEFKCNIDQIRYPVLMLLDLIEKEDYVQKQQHDINNSIPNSQHKIYLWEQMKETCLQIILERKNQLEFEMNQQIKQKEKIWTILQGTFEEKQGSKILIGPTLVGLKHGNYYYKNKDGSNEIAGEMYLNYQTNFWVQEGRYIQLYRQFRINFGVILKIGQIQYVNDGEIIRNDRIDYLKDNSQILTQLDQIKDLKWQGSYGQNGKKIGKWNVSLENQLINAGGNYQNDGLKIGNWIDLYQDYTKFSKAYLIGQYKEGRKYGRWKAISEKLTIGGGNYDEKGQKNGYWEDIVENYLGLNYLSFQGQYNSGRKSGCWQAIYNKKKKIILGRYDDNGLKVGQWVVLHKFFNPSCRVLSFGQYNNGKKFGQWIIQQTKKKIGGGMYNDEGKKVGQWKELSPNFQLEFQVFYAGLYEKGIRQGEWKIYYQDRLIGGGNYDQNGMKQGFWKDAHQNFSYRIQVIYQGEYSNGWKQGRWDIMFDDKVIGGGDYNQGIRQGKWVDIDCKYADYYQVLCAGEYLNGFKIGQWDTIFQEVVIGGGKYEDGIKNGKWIVQDQQWNQHKQLFQEINFQNGVQQYSN